jgi:quercetin dioxygenase-like cupin family protein
MLMNAPKLADYKDLKLKLDGIVPPGQQLFRNMLTDSMYASLPRDPEARVQVYNAEIVPGGYTNWHFHNGATFFIVLQGIFEARFADGSVLKAKCGDVYSEPIGKIHRGHNPHPELSFACIGVQLTSPDREPITNVDVPG